MKFKVWDKDHKKWADETEFALNSKGELIGLFGSVWDTVDSCYIPIYSTETNDKNGIEIFEGDIRGKHWWKYVVCFGDYSIAIEDCGVTLNSTGFYKRCLNKQHGLDFFDIEEDPGPYLGNKFENPELLEENEKIHSSNAL